MEGEQDRISRKGTGHELPYRVDFSPPPQRLPFPQGAQHKVSHRVLQAAFPSRVKQVLQIPPGSLIAWPDHISMMQRPATRRSTPRPAGATPGSHCIYILDSLKCEKLSCSIL